MSNAQRLKGRRAEAEVAAILRSYGFTVRGLESGGDHLAVRGAIRLHVEVKRQERGFRAAWARQAVDEAPEGSTPVVIYRASHAPWLIYVPASDPLAARVVERLSLFRVTVTIGGVEWSSFPLTVFLEALR